MTRKMGEYEVQIREDGYYNVTDFTKQVNEKHNKNKRVCDFLCRYSVKQLIKKLEDKNGKSPVDIIKSENTKYGRTPNEIWFEPFLFATFFSEVDHIGFLFSLFRKYNTDFLFAKIFNGNDSEYDESFALANLEYDVMVKEHFKQVFPNVEVVFESPINFYRVDAYLPQYKLYIEFDGGSHNTDNDKVKNTLIKKEGKTVYRYYNICDSEDNRLRQFLNHLSYFKQ